MRKLLYIIIAVLLVSTVSGCSSSTIATTEQDIQNTENKTKAYEQLQQINTECKLATLECRYNNVAKSKKAKGKGFFHIGEKDREFWIEYKGVMYLGVDVNDIQISVNETDVLVYIPEAEQVMFPDIDQNYLNGKSYVLSKDGFNQNKISAADQFKAISEAQDNMKNMNENNKGLYVAAKNIAKKQISDYIDNVGANFGITYNIHWSDSPLNPNEED